MVVMAAVYAQWYSVSGGLGGQQTYTEDAGFGAGEVPEGDSLLVFSGVEGSLAPRQSSPPVSSTPQEPPYLDLVVIKGTLQPTPTVEGFGAKPLIEAATAADHIVDANKMVLTEAEVIAVLRAAGAPEEWIPDMLTIAWCESKYSPGAVGDSGNSLGLYQLWSGWFYAGEDPFDPLTNARVAVRVREIRGRFGGGGGWSCATNNGIP